MVQDAELRDVGIYFFDVAGIEHLDADRAGLGAIRERARIEPSPIKPEGDVRLWRNHLLLGLERLQRSGGGRVVCLVEAEGERERVVSGKWVAVRVGRGGHGATKKKTR